MINFLPRCHTISSFFLSFCWSFACQQIHLVRQCLWLHLKTAFGLEDWPAYITSQFMYSICLLFSTAATGMSTTETGRWWSEAMSVLFCYDRHENSTLYRFQYYEPPMIGPRLSQNSVNSSPFTLISPYEGYTLLSGHRILLRPSFQSRSIHWLNPVSNSVIEAKCCFRPFNPFFYKSMSFQPAVLDGWISPTEWLRLPGWMRQEVFTVAIQI